MLNSSSTLILSQLYAQMHNLRQRLSGHVYPVPFDAQNQDQTLSEHSMDEARARSTRQSMRQMHQDPDSPPGRRRRINTSRISRGIYFGRRPVRHSYNWRSVKAKAD